MQEVRIVKWSKICNMSNYLHKRVNQPPLNYNKINESVAIYPIIKNT